MLSEQICALYKQGLSQAAVARRLKVSASFVQQTLVRCNVACRSSATRSPALLDDKEFCLAHAAALYMSGKPYAAIEARLRISTRNIKKAVIRFGGTPRHQRKLTAEEKAERAKARAAKLAVRRAASRVGRPKRSRTTKVDVDRLRKLYVDDRLPMTKVAAELGVSYGCVWWLIDRYNIPVRCSCAGRTNRGMREVRSA